MRLKPILAALVVLAVVAMPVCGQVPGDGWYLKGNSLYNEGKYYEAAEAYGRAIKSNPSHMLATHMLGCVHHRMGLEGTDLADFERAAYLHAALWYYEQALALDITHAPSWGNTALAFYQLGMYREYQTYLVEYNRLTSSAEKTTTVTYRQDYHIPGLGNVVIEPTYEFTYNPSQSVTPGRVVYR
jgi:tetratricopeptide (TPR) repeat protein